MKPFDDDHLINPATGLPMIGGIGGIDVGGDVFGSSYHRDSLFESSIDTGPSITDSTISSCDDSCSSFSSFDDSWSSCSTFDDSFSNTSSCDDW